MPNLSIVPHSRYLIPLMLSLWLLVNFSVVATPLPLRLATLEYPPFIYQENHQAKGLIVEIVQEAFRRMNQPVEIEFYPVARGLMMINNGDIDGYFTLKKTPERANKLLFTTQPLIQQTFVWFTRADSRVSYQGNLTAMAPFKIGVVSTASYGAQFDAAVAGGTLSNIETSRDFIGNLKKLIAGRVELIVNSYDVGMEIIRQLHHEAQIKTLEPPIEVVNSYLAFTRKKELQQQADDFDAVMRLMMADGTINRLKHRYPANISIGY
ncbi:transporter substrate-binding domain-containing protein [Shewanella yunxiaonensis]|uniref:Transporter substrate-binding domain-containing protein n=1 Tax=Shewanella yunxiaonensis TaxID=2829809 RepID=A0ABX7YT68_9GAMM|nr:transporter substrate-binding domain-containing protein [Shewanella yunxiaonensis]QUN05524.1 transporter substrate-binding domain-containing protein [Shewanella yunxiaonensis]